MRSPEMFCDLFEALFLCVDSCPPAAPFIASAMRDDESESFINAFQFLFSFHFVCLVLVPYELLKLPGRLREVELS